MRSSDVAGKPRSDGSHTPAATTYEALVSDSFRTMAMLKSKASRTPARVKYSAAYISTPRAVWTPPTSTMESGCRPNWANRVVTVRLAFAASPVTKPLCHSGIRVESTNTPNWRLTHVTDPHSPKRRRVIAMLGGDQPGWCGVRGQPLGRNFRRFTAFDSLCALSSRRCTFSSSSVWLPRCVSSSDRTPGLPAWTVLTS